jgi:argininosuccinate lyase
VLVPYDVWTNQAHARVLQNAGVFSAAECNQVVEVLSEILSRWEQGEWVLDPELEDVHINIEHLVTQRCGERVGGKLHSGRSRNDQVATDMKLYARDVLLQFGQEISFLLTALLNHARQHVETVMPGYTHHRKATLTTWAHWCLSYAQGLTRDLKRVQDIYARVNTSPLGAAASYGTTWPLDRSLAAELMAFDTVQENTLDAIMARGEAEAEIIGAAGMLMKRLSVIAQDLILFSTEEFGYLDLPADFTAGSSIMPQKRNPDFAEAIKAKTQLVLSYASALMAVNTSNLSGYNKDVQWTKYQFMDAVRETQHAAEILAEVFKQVQVNQERMAQAARTGFLNAVDIADYLARNRNIPFRATYKVLSDAVGVSEAGCFEMEQLNAILQQEKIPPLSQDEYDRLSEPLACVRSRDHIGSPHPDRVTENCQAVQQALDGYKQWEMDAQQRIIQAKQDCITLLAE